MLHKELLQSSKIRLQAINKSKILKTWRGSPSITEEKDSVSSNISESSDISSIEGIESQKIWIENDYLDTIYFDTFTDNHGIFELDNISTGNEENSTFGFNNGEPINEFIEYLKQNGIIYDIDSKSYKFDNYKQIISFSNNRRLDRYIPLDHFYKELQKEINFA